MTALSTAKRTNTIKRFFAAAIAAIGVFAAAVTACTVTDIEASAVSTDVATENYLFPLPVNGKTYYASVLANYSWGASHESYITRYRFKTGGASQPYSTVDIVAPNGTDVVAVKSGMVVENNCHNNGGNNIVIQHDDGTYSYYGHLLNRSALKVGTRVNAGDFIGDVGSGHLHFELVNNGSDPYCYYHSKGWLNILSNSGASKYPHNHSNDTNTSDTYTAKVINVPYALAINSRKSSGYQVGKMLCGETCTVDPSKSSKYWLYVTSNSGVSGWSYYKYLEADDTAASATNDNTGYTAKVVGCQNLALNRSPKIGTMLKALPCGTVVTVYERVGNFYKVQAGDTLGYCWYAYISC